MYFVVLYIVGYQANTIGTGYKMITPAFVAVSDGKYQIDDLKIIGSLSDGSTSIQTMNAEGSWTGMYYWCNDFTDPDTGTYFPAGWFKDQWGVEPAGITLDPAMGVFLYTPDSEVTFQSAGQVADGVTQPVATGYAMVGNASPVEISVDKLEVVGSLSDGSTSIQTMNAEGSWTGMYYWCNEFTDPDTGTYFPAGWFKDQWGVEPAGINLLPGETVFFYTPDTGVSVKIPSAIK